MVNQIELTKEQLEKMNRIEAELAGTKTSGCVMGHRRYTVTRDR